MKKINLKNYKLKTTSHKLNTGFVLLFAVTLAAIFLSIALGIADIALKEVNFGTSAKDTENAFNAAEVGTECALFYDNPSVTTLNAFGGSASMSCNGVSITPQFASPYWTFVVTGLNSDLQGCAVVTVQTSSLPSTTPPTMSEIVSKGYNKGGVSCNKPSGTIEREIDTPTF